MWKLLWMRVYGGCSCAVRNLNRKQKVPVEISKQAQDALLGLFFFVGRRFHPAGRRCPLAGRLRLGGFFGLVSR